jgi:glyoxylase-like metal-dependent hydrolase (beta-lactamase superfamily II)
MEQLTRITEHVFWLPPGPPDRPSLCAVVGSRRTVMLDGGSSPAHARELLRGLEAAGAANPPFAVVYTHAHWDHVFGGVEVGAPIVAQRLTAARLVELDRIDWSDEGLDRRVANGDASPEHAAHVKEELPAPRTVEVAPADIVFDDGIELELGDVRVTVRHVGGDHSRDSSVVYVEPDGVLVLGDCTSASPTGVMTAGEAFPLQRAIRSFGAERYVEGHHPSVVSRSEIDALFDKIVLAERAATEHRELEAPDEDTAYFLGAFAAGLGTVGGDSSV